jgi:AraC-like DNA-binding protein
MQLHTSQHGLTNRDPAHLTFPWSHRPPLVPSISNTQRHSTCATALRRARDRIDREYAQPLDVEALARGVHMSAGHLSRGFRRAYGESPYSYLMTHGSSVP